MSKWEVIKKRNGFSVQKKSGIRIRGFRRWTTIQPGRQVWIEKQNIFFREKPEERKVHAYVVVQSNRDYLYIVPQEYLEEYNAKPRELAYKRLTVRQRDLKVFGVCLGDKLKLWLSLEEFSKSGKTE